MVGLTNCLRYNHHCGCVTEEDDRGWHINKQCLEKHELSDRLCMDYPELEWIVIQREMD